MEQNRLLANLEARNRELREARSNRASIAPAVLASTFTLSGAPILKAKTIRPERMRPYKGQSEGEHLRWFRDVDLKFILSPEYFITDKDKVIFYI